MRFFVLKGGIHQVVEIRVLGKETGLNRASETDMSILFEDCIQPALHLARDGSNSRLGFVLTI